MLKTANFHVSLIGCLLILMGCSSPAETERQPVKSTPRDPWEATIPKLKPLHKTLGKPQPGEWLAEHEEDGQTYAEYRAGSPVTPTQKRTTFYIQPIGEFTEKQREIVALTAEFMGKYFHMPVKVQEALPLKIIPAKAKRTHPEWGVKQVLSTYVLHDVLRPRLPRDAVATLALCAQDLWPGEGWNFVFGQASLRHRVGVWSMARYGNPEESKEAFRLCLSRTLKTATHETGHMLSIQHCTAYECNMCGSNHLQESDSQPLFLCPECHAKVGWATDADAVQRFAELEKFCRKHDLKETADYYKTAAQALRENDKASDQHR